MGKRLEGQRPTLTVVKLGGSLTEGGALRGWLAAVARSGGGCCVVVPGGGGFADAVRTAQAAQRFSDRAAHQMALLAMEQCAIMLADLVPELTLCATASDMTAALAAGGSPVWLPSRMALADPSIAESWDVTSDSLAAWLARRVEARRLILIKSGPKPQGDPVAWAASGFVDAAFPEFVRDAAFAVECLGPGDEEKLARALALR
jgi:aspartokinase-like uncharacterized kinase